MPHWSAQNGQWVELDIRNERSIARPPGTPPRVADSSNRCATGVVAVFGLVTEACQIRGRP
jgi:hypothetical protein